MRTFSQSLVAAVLAVPASQAEAIECRDGFQRVQGHDISTPYCRDQYVAVVAREYGIQVSGAAIRNNPSTKRDVCRMIGRDIRVQTACLEVDSPSRGRP